MEAFVVNREGRLVFPANFWPNLDFSVFEAEGGRPSLEVPTSEDVRAAFGD